MATGRIGVTPTLRTRWSKAPAGGTTSLSGLDDNSVSLVYDVGYEGVYRNGVLLSRGNDYTATDGTTVTLIDATITGDIIEIFANELIPLSDAISKGQYTAKGALLSATAASTPGVLTVGSNDQVLTADSSTSTGLKWATPATGGLELVLTQTIGSGVSSVVVSNAFSSTYDNYLVLISGGAASGNCNLTLQLGSTTSGYYWVGYYAVTSGAALTAYNGSNTANFSYAGIGSTNDINSITTIQAPNLAKRTHISTTSSRANSASNPTINRNEGFEDSNTQHTAFTIAPDAGTLTGGTIKVYGYKN